MKRSGDEWQRWLGPLEGGFSLRADNNDSQGTGRAAAQRGELDVINLADDSSESDHTVATGAKVINVESSSHDVSSIKPPKNDSPKIAAQGAAESTQKAGSTKRRKTHKVSGEKRRKNAALPVFSADGNDPFIASRQSVEFIVRGKPLPQYRDKPGWNFTRYNPSKRYQKQFCQASTEQCLNHLSAVPNFGSVANISIHLHFRFPPPKTGLIKNTADIDNLCKFILDACNETFYGDDGQVVKLSADKGYDNDYGGEGFTRVSIGVSES